MRSTESAPSRLNPGPLGYAIAAALLGTTAFLHFGFFEAHSLWNNEFITLESIALPYPELIKERLSRNHVPGYFLFLKAWTGLVGQGQTALRSPSALFVFLGCLIVWRTGRDLFGAGLGLLTLALCGLNQSLIQIGYDARMYGMLFFASAAMLHCLIRYISGGKGVWLAGLVAAGLFGLSNQLLHLMPTVLAVFYVAWKRRSLGNRFWPLLLALLGPVVLLTPLVVAWTSAQDKVGTSDWSEFEGSKAFRTLVAIFIGDHKFLDWEASRALGMILVIVTLALAFRMSFRLERGHTGAGTDEPKDSVNNPFASLLLIQCVVPAIAIAIVGVRSSSQMVGSWRYYVTAAPAAHLLTTLIVGHLWNSGKHRQGAFVGISMVVVTLLHSIGFLLHPGQGVREAVQFAEERWEDGDAVLTGERKMRAHGFVYYGLIDARPPWRPKNLKQPDEIRDWIQESFPGANRLWVVFFNDDYEDERLYEALEEYPETFKLQGEIFVKGDTAAGLYAIADPSKGAR